MRAHFNYQTGRTFDTKLVENAHKKAKMCLMCGIFCGKRKCTECNYEQCKMCGIVCRPQPLYKVYQYVPLKGKRGISEERFNIVKPFCHKLQDGLCEDCVCWEDYIKDFCFICEQQFTNFKRNFKENGNCCQSCSSESSKRIKNINKLGLLKNRNYDSRINKLKSEFVRDEITGRPLIKDKIELLFSLTN